MYRHINIHLMQAKLGTNEFEGRVFIIGLCSLLRLGIAQVLGCQSEVHTPYEPPKEGISLALWTLTHWCCNSDTVQLKRAKTSFAKLPRFLVPASCPTCRYSGFRRKRKNQGRVLVKFLKNGYSSKEWSVHSSRWTQLWVKESSGHFQKRNIWTKNLKNYDSKNYEMGDICGKGGGGIAIPGAIWKSTG